MSPRSLLLPLAALLGAGALRGGAAEILCRRTDRPPRLSGDLSDPAWLDAAPVTRFFRLGTGHPAPMESVALMLHDGERIYLGVLMRKPPGEALSDRGLWAGDNAELFLDPGFTGSRYFQLAANRTDSFTARPGGGTDWDSGMEVAARPLPLGGWALELSVPFDRLGTAAPRKGEAWGANICRTDAVHGLHTAAVLSPIGGFHQPARFLPLRFAGPPGAGEATARELQGEALRRGAELAGEFARRMKPLEEAVGSLPAGHPGRAFLLPKLEAARGRANRAAATGEGLAAALDRKWTLSWLLRDLDENLSWEIRTAALFPLGEGP